MSRTLGLKGIDISKWQTTTPSLSGLAFVIVKATQGTTQDPMYATHYANCRKAGVVTMAYHWGTDAAVVAIKDQVAKFLAVAANADFLWLDQEESGFSDDEAQTFVDAVRAAGRPCGLYHSASGFGGVRADAQWVADYRDASVTAGYPRRISDGAEFPGWDLWQWQGSPLDSDWLNPASPLAVLLRAGYVTKAVSDAAVKDATDPLKAELASATAQIADLQAEVASLEAQQATSQAEVIQLQNDLAAAPAAEKERIAAAFGAAEADVIRSL